MKNGKHTSIGDVVYCEELHAERHIVVVCNDNVKVTLEGAKEQLELVRQVADSDFFAVTG